MNCSMYMKSEQVIKDAKKRFFILMQEDKDFRWNVGQCFFKEGGLDIQYRLKSSNNAFYPTGVKSTPFDDKVHLGFVRDVVILPRLKEYIEQNIEKAESNLDALLKGFVAEEIQKKSQEFNSKSQDWADKVESKVVSSVKPVSSMKRSHTSFSGLNELGALQSSFVERTVSPVNNSKDGIVQLGSNSSGDFYLGWC